MEREPTQPWSVTGIIYGTPATMGSKRIGRTKGGRPIIIDDKDAKLRSWQAEVRAAFRAVAPPSPILGAVRVRLTVELLRPGTHYNANGKLHPWAPRLCTTKPDADKLLRACLDPGTGLLWRDDSQVAEPIVTKCYTSGEPCVSFVIVEIEPDEAARKAAAAAGREQERDEREKVRRTAQEARQQARAALQAERAAAKAQETQERARLRLEARMGRRGAQS